MPDTHETLENMVLAGVNFMNAYLSLRRRVREKFLELASSPEWLNTPSSVRSAFLDINTLAENTHLTMSEDAVLLTEKQRHYQRNRKGNLRRRSYNKSRRLLARIATEKSTLSQAQLAPEQAAEQTEFEPNTSILPGPSLPPEQTLQAVPRDPELLRQIEAAKAKQAQMTEPKGE